ncbi:hypothetical protein D3C73_1276190 [compost metagenome]
MRAKTERGAMVAPTASPKRMARSAAPRFMTGRLPGKARSTSLACVLGAAPNCVLLPEKILESVESWVCVSSPMTISQFIICSSNQ